MRRLAAVLATLVALAASAPATAGPAAAVTYRPPVDAPIVDAFRPPAQNWNAGNRGLEYATEPGTSVAASAPGEVVFAGPVADGLHVVVLHDDGLRTSYSFLALVAVKRGDKVTQGQTLGTTRQRFHFGVRAGDAYLDPAKLFGGGPPEVHLVPDELRRPESEAKERAGLARMFRGLASRAAAGGVAAADWARDRAVDTVEGAVGETLDEVRGAIHFAHATRPSTHLARFASAAHAWWKARDTCTPQSEPPPKLQERHMLVRVAGLGSTSDEGAIDDLDGAALGYAKADDSRFSYRGGTTDDNRYTVTDTTQDIRRSGRQLRDLLARIEAANPGVPIDIVAHSQGGLVARSALTDEGEPTDPRLPKINSLVTLGTPHRGAPTATALTMVGHTTVGEVVLKRAHAALPDKIDPAGTSVTQMAEHSEFLRRLNVQPLPPGLKATSVAAREDLAVPAGQTALRGADSVTVAAPGVVNDHGRLPGSPQGQREVALAVAGRKPTCQSFGDAMADAAVSGLIYAAEEGLAGGAWLAARRVDRKVGNPPPKPSVPRRHDND